MNNLESNQKDLTEHQEPEPKVVKRLKKRRKNSYNKKHINHKSKILNQKLEVPNSKVIKQKRDWFSGNNFKPRKSSKGSSETLQEGGSKKQHNDVPKSNGCLNVDFTFAKYA